MSHNNNYGGEGQIYYSRTAYDFEFIFKIK